MIKEISIEEIPKLPFEGYYWLSNASYPEEVKDGEALKEVLLRTKNTLPFIVEANLFNADQQKGISVRHIDGKHMIYLIELDALDTSSYTVVEKNFKNILKRGDYKMLEIWKTEKDPLLEEISVKKPHLSVFAGFEK